MLCAAFNRFVLSQARLYCPRGFDVMESAPATLEDATRYWRDHGRVAVWSGASDSTIFGDSHVNHAFRAWHDSHHIAQGLEFDRQGESQTMLAQIRDARFCGADFPLFARLLECEVIGQFDFAESNGFPINQEQFAREYLAARGVVF